jgi:ABC-type tungstate transport system substrate-binding protein
MMWKFFKHLFTEANNEVYDIKRILGATGVVGYTGAVVHQLATGVHIDFSSLGIGYGAIIGATGGAMMMGSGAETPTAEDGKPI